MTALRFIVGTLLDLYIFTFILRAILQWVRADSYNPFWQFVVQVTNPLVRPLRRVIPGWRGHELATPLLVLALECAAVVILLLMSGYGVPGFSAILYYAVLRTVLAVLNLYWLALFVYVLLSWINPGASHPLTRVLAALCEPMLRPLRRVIPLVGGFDLSPLIPLIGLQALARMIGPLLPGMLGAPY